MIRTIKLTTDDCMNLLLALGYAQGAAVDRKDVPMSFLEITDRILIQLGGTNYTYGKPREEVVADLLKDGIEVPE